jgi:hypothetical protein
MKTTIDMARESKLDIYGLGFPHDQFMERVKAFEALVRADEREQGQKWFDAVTAQHKQEILAEREACAKVCESEAEMFKSCAYGANDGRYDWKEDGARECATAIRARGENT